MLEVGTIQSPHGLKGALSVYSYTRPAIGIAGYSFWYLGTTPETAKKIAVERCWQHGKRLLAEFTGVNDVDAAAALKGLTIWVDVAEVELDKDEYLWDDLIGCEVVDESGRLLGEVVALEEYGAQDILTVRTPEDAELRGEWMIPFTEEIVTGVDIEARRIEVALPEGMDACFTPSS
ncbi:MAG TPA: ribosome maturation factor RimM [Mariprofundaceae bacterium]|nr:ribosome maturation factor RimM [Mariprofundaceae bacterium]